MKILSTREMFRLYRLVGNHLPDSVGEDFLVDFIGTIINSMVNKGQLTNYIDAIMLMSGKSLEELKGMKPEELIKIFAEGLADNKIFSFRNFLESVEFNNG